MNSIHFFYTKSQKWYLQAFGISIKNIEEFFNKYHEQLNYMSSMAHNRLWSTCGDDYK